MYYIKQLQQKDSEECQVARWSYRKIHQYPSRNQATEKNCGHTECPMNILRDNMEKSLFQSNLNATSQSWVESSSLEIENSLLLTNETQ